jgi:hypothetical protein
MVVILIYELQPLVRFIIWDGRCGANNNYNFEMFINYGLSRNKKKTAIEALMNPIKSSGKTTNPIKNLIVPDNLSQFVRKIKIKIKSF